MDSNPATQIPEGITLLDANMLSAYPSPSSSEPPHSILGLSAPRLSIVDYQTMLDRQWRRRGHYLYKDEAAGCPMRVDVREFKVADSHKEVLAGFNRFLVDGEKGEGEEKADLLHDQGLRASQILDERKKGEVEALLRIVSERYLSEEVRGKVDLKRKIMAESRLVGGAHYLEWRDKVQVGQVKWSTNVLVKVHEILKKEKLDCALGSPQELAEKLEQLEILKPLDGAKILAGGILAFTVTAGGAEEAPAKPWYEMTKSTRYGKTHPDTFFCNDLPKLEKHFPNSLPRITQLDFYTDGNQIYGYEVVYEPSGGNQNATRPGEGSGAARVPVHEVGHHIGTMLTPAVKLTSFKLDLEKDEHIKVAIAYSQNLVDRLEFTTSLGNQFSVGRDASPDDLVSKVDMTQDDSRLVSFNCGLGGHIHNIEFTVHGTAYSGGNIGEGAVSDPRRCSKGHMLECSWTRSRFAGTEHTELSPFRCDLCGEGFTDHDFYYCRACDFDVHPGCQGLPRRSPQYKAKESSQDPDQPQFLKYLDQMVPIETVDPATNQPKPLKHAYTIEITRAMYSEEVYQCYRKYQAQINGVPSTSKQDFEEFLCQVPLFDPTDSDVSSSLPEDDEQFELEQEVRSGSSRAVTAKNKGRPDDLRELRFEGMYPQFRGGYHMLHRIDGELMAVGVIDITFNAVISVYSFFDPKFAHLSPSTLLALREIEYVRKINQDYDDGFTYYYMGQYKPNSPSAHAKELFTPSQVACPHTYNYVYLTDDCKKMLAGASKPKLYEALADPKIEDAGSYQKPEEEEVNQILQERHFVLSSAGQNVTISEMEANGDTSHRGTAAAIYAALGLDVMASVNFVSLE